MALAGLRHFQSVSLLPTSASPVWVLAAPSFPEWERGGGRASREGSRPRDALPASQDLQELTCSPLPPPRPGWSDLVLLLPRTKAKIWGTVGCGGGRGGCPPRTLDAGLCADPQGWGVLVPTARSQQWTDKKR